MVANYLFARWQQIVLPLLLVIVATFQSGCNKDPMRPYPAGGTVTFTDGKPLDRGTVMLRATDAPKPVSARGDIQPDGTFRLSTFGKDDGAIAGVHQVSIQPPPTPPSTDRDVVRRIAGPPFHEKYLDFSTSELTITVTQKASDNNFSIELERTKTRRR